MRIVAAGSVVVLIALAIFLVRPAPIADLDAKTCDILTTWAGPGKPSGKVAVVEIDENSLAQFGRWPWPRSRVAQLTTSILNHGAAAVVLDMMFPQEDPGDDPALAQALAGKPVVVGYTFSFDSREESLHPCTIPPLPLAVSGPVDAARPAFFEPAGTVCNVAEIAHAASGSGFLNASPDRDGTLRVVPVAMRSGGQYYPSLALAALNLYHHSPMVQLATDSGGAARLRVDGRVIPLEAQSLLRLRFRGNGRSFPRIAAADLMVGNPAGAQLRGKIVVVGGAAPGIENPVVTPVDASFPDVEVQATAIDNLLRGDPFHRPANAPSWELLFALLAGVFSTVLLTRPPSLWGVWAVAGFGAGAWACCALLVANAGLLISPLPLTTVLAANLPLLALVNYVQEKRRADRTQRELAASTQRSRAVLRESENRYQRLVENVNDAIIVDDVSGRLTFANRRFREWFGLEESDVGQTMLERYVAPEWRAEVRDRHDRRVRGEAVPEQFEFEGIRPDGTRVWIEALVTAVEEGGRIVGTQAALRDATNRKRIEAQYFQAQKMESVGRLAGGVAHDFNNLLTVINGYSALLLGRLAPEDRSRQGLMEIRKAGERAAELTQKLLAFSRKKAVQTGVVSLNAVVAETQKMLERLIGEDIQLITRLAPDLAPVLADAGQLHQVLMNLVVNARDAMPDGGTITIETANAGAESVSFCVADTGIGMSDDVKRHLYEPFFTTKESGKGTGLGLATVYGIVQQCGGRIDVASELGHGTRIQIYLPRTSSISQKPPAPEIVSSLRGTETVLVVEDQEAVRRIACTILESYGYRVLQASNGPDAIAIAEQHTEIIHLLLTDIILPTMDGRVLADKLCAARPGLKVLYISGYSEERIGSGAELAGGLAYLPKPFTSDTLARRVREMLSQGEEPLRRRAP